MNAPVLSKVDQIRALREGRAAPVSRKTKSDLADKLRKSIIHEDQKARRKKIDGLIQATRSEGEQMTVTTVRVRKGRPPKTIKTEVQLGVRFTLDQIAKIDAYCEKYNVTRPEAVRRMIDADRKS